MEKEMEFCNYGEKDGIIQVAGGGMMNGNAYATVELISDRGEEPKYWYCEYGAEQFSEYRGNKLVYDDEGCNFDIIEEEPTDLWAKLAKEEEKEKRLMEINAKLKADIERIKDENKRLEEANKDYYLTGKGLKRGLYKLRWGVY